MVPAPQVGRQAGINDEKKRLEKTKKRIGDLDKLNSRCYEDAVLGNLSRERYAKMTQGYEEDQDRLKAEVETLEEWVEYEEEMSRTWTDSSKRFTGIWMCRS